MSITNIHSHRYKIHFYYNELFLYIIIINNYYCRLRRYPPRFARLRFRRFYFLLFYYTL